MAVVQMKRMNLVALKPQRKAILSYLQEKGVLQIDAKKTQKIKKTSHQDTSAERSEFEKNVTTADRALDILGRVVPEKTSMFASLEGKPVADQATYAKTVERRDELLGIAEAIISLDKEISEDQSAIARLLAQAETMVPWLDLDIPMRTKGTKSTALFIGTVPPGVDETAILTALKTYEKPVEKADVELVRVGRDGTNVTVLTLKEDAAAAEEALRTIGFSALNSTSDLTPAEEKQRIEDEIETLKANITAHEDGIRSYEDCRTDLKLVSDYYRLRADKYAVIASLAHTEKTFSLSGYIPADQAEGVAQVLEEEFGAAVEIEEIGKKEKPPVLLKNNKVSESVEGVLASYGLPKKGEIDPTLIMSIFYIVLFGMMLSDAGYGILMAVGCAVILKKFPNMSKSLHKSLKMFCFCGISTTVWGFLFGSFFGDLITVVSENWFGVSVSFPTLWFTPLDDPMRLLIYSLLIGLVHMFIGMGIKGYMMLKKGDVVGFVSDIIAWYMFLVGLIMILLPTSIFESISGMTFVFPAAVNTLAIVLTVAGALIILVMSGRRKGKHIAIRLALGAYDIYGITSWLSDILSYSRLLALGLATGVIAQVINQMGSMFGTGIIGTILFIVIFLVGTALNMAINILGAYVHSNRLEFVEFFNKFYDGGGEPFTPFEAVTKYVSFARIKEGVEA